MRYNVHQSRNKIGRVLGVLVGAALVATFGAAERRAGTEASGADGGRHRRRFGRLQRHHYPNVGGGAAGGRLPGIPGIRSNIQSLANHAKADARGPVYVFPPPLKLRLIAIDDGDDIIQANDPRIHHGVWKVRVSYWNKGMATDCGRRRSLTVVPGL